MIEIRNVSKTFDHGATWAARDVSLRVDSGKTLVLLGSSGCGKTTTLKMVNRLVTPDEGQVLLHGEDVREKPLFALRRSIGYVFQEIGLFPHLSVGRNIGIVPRLLGWSGEKRNARSRELLSLVGLDPEQHFDRRPHELSGGQQQRVGIARALAADPEVLLMDEPFGALDALTREALQDETLRLRESLGKTIVFVTHDIAEAARLGDVIAVMHAGGVEQAGTFEELTTNPATDFVRDLVSKAQRQAERLISEDSS